MYLFLGQDCVINSDEIIGIFDLDNTSASRVTKEYLSRADKAGNVITVASDIPKSFVVCRFGAKTSVYLSQMSAATLRKRADYIEDIINI